MFAVVGYEHVTLEELAARRREIDAMEAEWLRMVAAYDRNGDFVADGHANAAVALRVACRLTGGAARGHVDVARKLEQLPATAEAFREGAISRSHAALIADAYTPERAGAIAELEPTLVAAAKRLHPRDLRAVLRHATDALDGDGGASADDNAYRRRRVHLSTTIGGMGVLDGQLDPESTEIVISALNAEMERDRRPNEDRTRTQRRADALTNLCRRQLDAGAIGGSRKVRPHVTMVGDLELLAADEKLIGEARAEAAHVGHISQATLERFTCDCTLSRVITAGRSEVLDVGRATRTIPPALWKALVVRDRHCQAPGCDRPPGWCEAHHIIHWSKGGPTSLDNLQLLCWQHHRRRHFEPEPGGT